MKTKEEFYLELQEELYLVMLTKEKVLRQVSSPNSIFLEQKVTLDIVLDMILQIRPLILMI